MHKLLEQLVAQMVEKGIQYEDALREFDRRFIVEVVDKSDGNLCKAADTLGVHRNTLARKMKEFKIQRGSRVGLMVIVLLGLPWQTFAQDVQLSSGSQITIKSEIRSIRDPKSLQARCGVAECDGRSTEPCTKPK